MIWIIWIQDDMDPGRTLRLRCGALILDDMFGGLANDAAFGIEAAPSSAPGDLFEVADSKQCLPGAVVLRELREQDSANRNVDADSQRICSADHLQQACLREFLDEAPVFGQQARVVQADAVPQDAAQILSVRRIEAEVADGFRDGHAFLFCRNVRAGQRLRVFGCGALGKVDDVDRRAAGLKELLDRFVKRSLGITIVERHGARVAVNVRDLASRSIA